MKRLRLRRPSVRVALRPRLLPLLLAAGIMQAFTFNIFLAPTRIAPGGVSGLALIVNHFLHTPLGMTQLTLSLPMLALGFWFLGRLRFLVSVSILTLVYTFGVDIMAPYLPDSGITTDPLLNALFGGVLGGIGSGLAYRAESTFAGTGILSRIVQLRTGIPITQLYIAIDGAIIVVLGLVFGWDNALYSLIMLFVWGMATDYVLEGPSVVRTVFIITSRATAVADAIIARMGVGVTHWSAEGMFTHQSREILFCTISRPDVRTLRETVTEVDPHAFIVVGQGHNVKGGILRPPKTPRPT
ncbi:MAG: YitT family protein [Caldilineae bacterium]|nr:MAG: YitT family protein [Caldilineae bacterium]